MIENRTHFLRPVLKPADESGADKPTEFPDERSINTVETTVRVLEYMEKNGCSTLGDMRRKITGATLLVDDVKTGSRLYREITKFFVDTGSTLRGADNENLDRDKQ